MARPVKISLDYFPMDVDYFDDVKLMTVAEQFGPIGELIAIKMTCFIYKQGYAVEWNDMTELIFTKRVMGDISCRETVKSVVNSLIECGYFSKDVFERTGYLTSRGIQVRWVSAQSYCKRKVNIDASLSVLNEETTSKTEETPFNDNLQEFLTEKKEETTVKTEETPFNDNLQEFLTEKKEEMRQIKEKNIILNKTPYNPPTCSFDETNEDCACLSEEARNVFDQTVNAWNDVFPEGDPRHVHSMNTNSLFRLNLDAAISEGISVVQLRSAFSALKKSDFSWQLHSAVKPENVRLLLTGEQLEGRKKIRSDPKRAHHVVAEPKEYVSSEEWNSFAQSK